ncbi:MAG: hypothetical protein NTY79_02690 [Chloroflexi bacterium]|nr:hypothetical protein [Chloroflexota bacterium]
MAPLFILIAILALIVLALAVPVEIEISAAIHGRAVSKTRFRLLFGLISFDADSGPGKKEPGKKEPGKMGGDGVPFLEKLFNAVQVEGIWSGLWKLAQRLAPCVRVKRLASDLTVSAGDDYYTGMLAGLAIPLVLYLNQRFDGEISLRPAFEEDLLLEGDLFAGFSLRPLKMILPCLVFACSPQFRRVKRIFSGG